MQDDDFIKTKHSKNWIYEGHKMAIKSKIVAINIWLNLEKLIRVEIVREWYT